MAVVTVHGAAGTAVVRPWGARRRARRSLVEALDVGPGQRVLELGCGGGEVTELLVASGAEVVAVDVRPEMLVGARQRAPGATLLLADSLDADVGTAFDRVVLPYVLHDLDAADRVRLLRRAADATIRAGRVGVLDWAQPRGRLTGSAWRGFLRVMERSPAVPDLLDGALDTEVPAAGLRISHRRHSAGGRAQILILDRGERV